MLFLLQNWYLNFIQLVFRCYALRKVRDTFRVNKTLQAPDEVSNRIEEAKASLELIKRQVLFVFLLLNSITFGRILFGFITVVF